MGWGWALAWGIDIFPYGENMGVGSYIEVGTCSENYGTHTHTHIYILTKEIFCCTVQISCLVLRYSTIICNLIEIIVTQTISSLH